MASIAETTALIRLLKASFLVELEKNADYIEVGKKEVQKTKEIENSAETAVKNLEKDQTQANLDLATSKVDAVTDADKKEKFQKRIATVKTAIEAKKEKELEDKAETAVKNLENNQSRDNIDDAKNKVNAVNNGSLSTVVGR